MKIEDFSRSIHEDPDDPSRQLVFADWLDENGHPEWAQAIRDVNGRGIRTFSHAMSLPARVRQNPHTPEVWASGTGHGGGLLSFELPAEGRVMDLADLGYVRARGKRPVVPRITWPMWFDKFADAENAQSDIMKRLQADYRPKTDA